MAEVLPKSFGRYRVVERIAEGGMADIFRARLDGIGGFQRSWAIKRVRPHLSGHGDYTDLLVEEAKIGGLLNHANIVVINEMGEQDGQLYLVMEFVDGPDLARVLQQCRDKGITLPLPEAVFIAIEMLKALEYAHNRVVSQGGRETHLNLVHRDITPSNVLISKQGEVKLTDFGIARSSIRGLETVAGVVKGRFDYLSPEQADGRPADQRSDLFACGVALYEMLTGQHPFRRRTEAATLEAIRLADTDPPSGLNPDIPVQVEQVVQRALQADPSRRYPSATAMKEALDAFIHGAGFVVSNARLAAFLKKLEDSAAPDEASPGPPVVAARESAEDPATGATAPQGPGPRFTIDGGKRPAAAAPPPAPPADPRPDSLARRASEMLDSLPELPPAPTARRRGGSEESTVIRRNPLTDDPSAWGDGPTRIHDEAKARARAAAIDDEDLELPDPEAPPEVHVGRRRPPRPEELNRRRTSAPAPAPGPAPGPAGAAGRAQGRPARRAPLPAPEAAARPPGRRVAQLAWLVSGAVVTVMVLLVGYFLGLRAAELRADLSPRPVATPTEVELSWPADMRVTINDKQVAGSSPQRLPLSRDARIDMSATRPGGPTLRIDVADGAIRAVDLRAGAPAADGLEGDR